LASIDFVASVHCTRLSIRTGNIFVNASEHKVAPVNGAVVAIVTEVIRERLPQTTLRRITKNFGTHVRSKIKRAVVSLPLARVCNAMLNCALVVVVTLCSSYALSDIAVCTSVLNGLA
jgi:hypothetical protein